MEHPLTYPTMMNSQEFLTMMQVMVTFVYFFIYIASILSTKLIQSFNFKMPIKYKLKTSVIYMIPLSIIASAVLASTSLHFTSDHWYWPVGGAVFLLLWSFVLTAYALLFLTYYAKKSLDLIYISSINKWYCDETAFKFTLFFNIVIYAFPFLVVFITSGENNKKMIIEGVDNIRIFSTILNILFIGYFITICKTIKYFDRMMLVYIDDLTVSDEIHNSTHLLSIKKKFIHTPNSNNGE